MHDPDSSLEKVLPASAHANRGKSGTGGKDEAPFHGNSPLDATRPARVGAETAERGLAEAIHEIGAVARVGAETAERGLAEAVHEIGAVAHGLGEMFKEVEHNLVGDLSDELDALDAPTETMRTGRFFFFNGKRELDTPVARPTNFFRGRVHDLVRAGRCRACQDRRAEGIALQLGSKHFERLSLLTILGNCVTMGIARQPIPH